MDWFQVRDHPQKVVSEQIDKEVLGNQPSRKDTSPQGVPFLPNMIPNLKTLTS